MLINLKEIGHQALDKIPGDDLEGIIQLAVNDKADVSCLITGDKNSVKALLCSVLEQDSVRDIFEECYTLVLAKRAGMSTESNN